MTSSFGSGVVILSANFFRFKQKQKNQIKKGERSFVGAGVPWLLPGVATARPFWRRPATGQLQGGCRASSPTKPAA